MRRAQNTTKPKTSKSESRPLAQGRVVRSTPATFKNHNDGSISISKREFVGSYVVAGAGFQIHPLTLVTPGLDFNPACSSMFPWLSGIATNYERYRFNKLKIDVIPSSNATISGRQYLAIDYDYDDAPANTKAGIMSNRTAAEAQIWQEVSVTADPKELNRDLPYRYVSSGSKMNAVEPRTAYSGFFLFATDSPTAGLVFDFWVDYQVELLVPVIESTVGVDNFTGYTAPPASTVLSPVGTGYANVFGGTVGNVLQNIMAVTPGSPIMDVVTGQSGVPVLPIAINGTIANAIRALDISGSGGRGSLSLLTKFSVTGSAPGSVASTGPTISGGAFDSKGTYLGDLTSAALKSVRTVGSELNTTWATLGANLLASMAFTIPNLLALYPTARFLVPYINSGTTLGAGTLGHGFKFEL
jgi:hypothetical protein